MAQRRANQRTVFNGFSTVIFAIPAEERASEKTPLKTEKTAKTVTHFGPLPLSQRSNRRYK
jgi:hypothetical protein